MEKYEQNSREGFTSFSGDHGEKSTGDSEDRGKDESPGISKDGGNNQVQCIDGSVKQFSVSSNSSSSSVTLMDTSLESYRVWEPNWDLESFSPKSYVKLVVTSESESTEQVEATVVSAVTENMEFEPAVTDEAQFPPEDEVISKEDEPWSQPFFFKNLPEMFKATDPIVIDAHIDLFVLNPSKSSQEDFLKECLSKSPELYFVNICLNLSRDSRIMQYLKVIMNVIFDWEASRDKDVTLRLTLVIMALFRNDSCTLNSVHRRQLAQYLLRLIPGTEDAETLRTLGRRISSLLLLAVQKSDDGNAALSYGVVDFDNDDLSDSSEDGEGNSLSFRPSIVDVIPSTTKKLIGINKSLFLQINSLIEKNLCDKDLNPLVVCPLLDILLLMPITALFHILPKSFDNLCKIASDGHALIEGRRGAKLLPKDNLINGVYWKLRDACEILLDDFFKENFTPAAVIDSVSSLLQCVKIRLDHESEWAFYKKALEYFGKDLTNPLSEKYTREHTYDFLALLDKYCEVRIFRNRFMTVPDCFVTQDRENGKCIFPVLHQLRDEERAGKRATTNMYSYPTIKETSQSIGNFRELELRGGLIDLSRTSENAAPRSLASVQNVKVPDELDTNLLNEKSRIYAQGCSKRLK